jgi:hypothetical protein
MAEHPSSSANGGIGFCGLLAIVFITLKLLGYITWSWWWVLAPIWIPAVISIVGIVVVLAFFARAENVFNRKD